MPQIETEISVAQAAADEADELTEYVIMRARHFSTSHKLPLDITATFTREIEKVVAVQILDGTRQKRRTRHRWAPCRAGSGGLMDRWGDSQRDRDALDRHITGNYGEDQFRDEIADGMFQWEPGTLATKVVERILTDALADMWQDCYRRDDAAGRLHQRALFREKLMELIRCATGEGMRVT